MAEGRKPGTPRPLLIIMLKAPVMGRTKTRLAGEIGLAAATRFARVCARTLIERLARDRRWRTGLAVTPDGTVASRMWPAHCPAIGQGSGDLGARMARLLGPAMRPAILIGADIPGVSPSIIGAAFDILRRNDVVFGPAEDGGYWLVGLNRGAPRTALFRDVRWSTEFALADSLADLAESRIGYAPCLADVDDAQNYCRWAHRAACVTLPRSGCVGLDTGPDLPTLNAMLPSVSHESAAVGMKNVRAAT